MNAPRRDAWQVAFEAWQRRPGAQLSLEAGQAAAGDDELADRCDECGRPLEDDEGEGYDGLCGPCADRAEESGRWDGQEWHPTEGWVN